MGDIEDIEDVTEPEEQSGLMEPMETGACAECFFRVSEESGDICERHDQPICDKRLLCSHQTNKPKNNDERRALLANGNNWRFDCSDSSETGVSVACFNALGHTFIRIDIYRNGGFRPFAYFEQDRWTGSLYQRSFTDLVDTIRSAQREEKRNG